MAGIRDLQRMSQSQKSFDQEDRFTEDGGVILGLGWVKYFDEASKHDFYTHEQLGTQWEFPSELAERMKLKGPEVDDDNISQLTGHIENEDQGDTNIHIKKERKGRGMKTQSSTMMLFQEVEQSEIEELEDDDKEYDERFQSGSFNGSSFQTNSYRDDDDDTRETPISEVNDDTDESDDDMVERARRLGGGFRSKLKPPTPPPIIDDTPQSITLGESSQAMLDKLSQSRATNNGDVMSNQAAFNAQGMLMLESIQNKGDPNLEQDADPEVMAKLEAERVRFQDEMEKIRDSFTDKELFRLREEFNDVDADRSGYIDDDELKILLTLLNDSKVPSEDEVRRVMATADQSGDGQLDFLEFLALVKSLRDERKADASVMKSIKKFLDTVKTDLLGGVLKDIESYQKRAYRFFNHDKIIKQEKREAERLRIKEEKEFQKRQDAEDMRILEEEEAAIQENIMARHENTGLETEILFDGNDIDFPDETDVVTIHIKLFIYEEDKEFDSFEVIENSRKRRQPFKFKCNGGAVISGLALSIPKMSLGMKARILCPPEFAYGEKGLPPKVPPNSTLLIEVELLSFETLEENNEEGKEIDMST